MKKPKKETVGSDQVRKTREPATDTPAETKPKRKRRRKGGATGNAGNGPEDHQPAEDVAGNAEKADE